MNQDEKISFTHSSILNKDGKPYISVRFERGSKGVNYAEGSIPQCKIIEQNGFSSEEIQQLEVYLEENSNDIKAKAKEISGIRYLLRK